MATFTTGTMDSTAEKDPEEFENFLGAAQQRAQAAQKQFGSIYETKTPSLSLKDRMQAEKAYGAGEQTRRESAATGASELAGKIDTRSTTVADQVRNALNQRNRLGSTVATAQQQQDVTQEQTLRGQNQNFINQLNEINYKGAEQAASRMDTMQAAYDKGMLEYQLIDQDRQGMLALSDIERYFAIQTADVDNQMKMLGMMSDLDLKQFIAKIEAQGQGWASLISGLGAGATAYITSGE